MPALPEKKKIDPKVKRRLQILAIVIGFAVVLGETAYIVINLLKPAAAGNVGYAAARGAAIDGILCEGMEGQAMHIHSQLQLFDNGTPVPIPANIGIVNGCYYWLHTHTPDGIIHVESSVVKTFTLGMFFRVWGKEPFGKGTGFHVLVDAQDGKGFQPYTGDYEGLVLRSHEVIAMGTGDFTPMPFTFPGNL